MSSEKEENEVIDGQSVSQRLSKNDPYRIEHWYDAIREHTFETVFIDVDSETCVAISKYFETSHQWARCISLEDNLDERMILREEVSKRFPCSESNKALLDSLERRLDEVIRSFGEDGAFVKLSSRSPKDTAIQMHSMRVMIADSLKRDRERAGKEMTEREWHCSGVSAFVDACCKVLRVKSGAEAMYLMINSDRVYTDISRMLLVNNGNAELRIAVRRWDPRVVPALEFRAFVYGHTMTACTQYYKIVYYPEMAEHKEEISNLIRNYHDQQLKPLISLPNYTIDFAVTADLKDIVCVELNNLPPSAGTALFDWNNPHDRDVIEHGPYEFRCNTSFKDESFQEVVEPLQIFIDSLRETSDVHAGFSCGCCGEGLPKLNPDVNPASCGIHGVRYHCKDCISSFDICSACWEAGWGLRHVRQSQSDCYPAGHRFEKFTSPVEFPVDSEPPPEGPKTEIHVENEEKKDEKENSNYCYVL